MVGVARFLGLDSHIMMTMMMMMAHHQQHQKRGEAMSRSVKNQHGGCNNDRILGYHSGVASHALVSADEASGCDREHYRPCHLYHHLQLHLLQLHLHRQQQHRSLRKWRRKRKRSDHRQSEGGKQHEQRPGRGNRGGHSKGRGDDEDSDGD